MLEPPDRHLGLKPNPARWKELFGEALNIVDAVNRNGDILGGWTLGGGTAIMLRIDHRDSRDVDLFLDDPQLLPYVRAEAADMRFGIGEPTCGGDGSVNLKLNFDGIGEIDFIISGHVTDAYAEKREILGREILVETIPEVVAKKIVFRAPRIQPRDVFDIAAACESGYRGEIEAVLADYPEEAAAMQRRLSAIPLDKSRQVMDRLVVRPKFKYLASCAMRIVQETIAKSLEKDFDPGASP